MNVRVKLYDIVWETDGEDVRLPETVFMDVDEDIIPDGLADALSDRYGWLVASGPKYRRIHGRGNDRRA